MSGPPTRAPAASAAAPLPPPPLPSSDEFRAPAASAAATRGGLRRYRRGGAGPHPEGAAGRPRHSAAAQQRRAGTGRAPCRTRRGSGRRAGRCAGAEGVKQPLVLIGIQRPTDLSPSSSSASSATMYDAGDAPATHADASRHTDANSSAAASAMLGRCVATGPRGSRKGSGRSTKSGADGRTASRGRFARTAWPPPPPRASHSPSSPGAAAPGSSGSSGGDVRKRTSALKRGKRGATWANSASPGCQCAASPASASGASAAVVAVAWPAAVVTLCTSLRRDSDPRSLRSASASAPVSRLAPALAALPERTRRPRRAASRTSV